MTITPIQMDVIGGIILYIVRRQCDNIVEIIALGSDRTGLIAFLFYNFNIVEFQC